MSVGIKDSGNSTHVLINEQTVKQIPNAVPQ